MVRATAQRSSGMERVQAFQAPRTSDVRIRGLAIAFVVSCWLVALFPPQTPHPGPVMGIAAGSIRWVPPCWHSMVPCMHAPAGGTACHSTCQAPAATHHYFVLIHTRYAPHNMRRSADAPPAATLNPLHAPPASPHACWQLGRLTQQLAIANSTGDGTAVKMLQLQVQQR